LTLVTEENVDGGCVEPEPGVHWYNFRVTLQEFKKKVSRQALTLLSKHLSNSNFFVGCVRDFVISAE
jgi:hypothetical protein